MGKDTIADLLTSIRNADMNKKGTVRKQINIFIVFLISGIWHGSSWNFILWGGLHGLFYIIEEISNRIRNIRDDQNQELFGA